MTAWSSIKKILCIRPDNMGDLIMTSPAIRALKETFECHIAVLTSSLAKDAAGFMPYVDEVIVYNVPWVKSGSVLDERSFFTMADLLKRKKFDAAIVFTVFSQNPLPSAMLAFLAGIPKRLAYCRENPYALLTDWVPDPEPYHTIEHQVVRDLHLVKHIGASTSVDSILLEVPHHHFITAGEKLVNLGVDLKKPWLIFHPGVSEKKRAYREDYWTEAGKKIINGLRYQVLLTGESRENELTERIAGSVGKHAFSCAGLFTLSEFASVIREAPLVVSVNTSAIHLAAAFHTRQVVLYALTNPQHTPWKGVGKILPFSIEETGRSRNEILRFVHEKYFSDLIPQPSPEELYSTVKELLTQDPPPPMPELVQLQELHPATQKSETLC